MRISKISFNGYKEEVSQRVYTKETIDELKNASPYLQVIGEWCLPPQKDLFVRLRSGRTDDFLTAHYIDRDTGRAVIIAKETEHSLTGYGMNFVQKVFEGLKKHSEADFNEIAKKFVLNLERVDRKKHPPVAYKPSNDFCEGCGC